MVQFIKDGDSRRGLTLVEMLTVLFVVSILVAFVTGTARYASRAAETRRAEADLHLLADALERYYLRFGDYPPEAEDEDEDEDDKNRATDLLTEVRPLPGGGDYVFSNSLPRTFTAIDPWGTAYQYLRHGTTDPDAVQTFTLYSLGPDREEPAKNDTPDDNITL